MGVTYKRVTVTPAKAREWLGLNSMDQRGRKNERIIGYARDMLAGAWNSDSGETIKFDVNGTLIDGQNRLAAVIKANVAVPFDVAHGLPANAMKVIDSGASRSAGDFLRMAGATDRAATAAIVRWVLLWDQGMFTGKVSAGGAVSSPTSTELIERYQEESGSFDAALKRARDCRTSGLGLGAPIGTAHFLFARIDTEACHQFFDQYVTGANLPGGSAVLALRNRMARSRIDRLTRPEMLSFFVRGWNAWRSDTPVERLIMQRGELTNANFPQPK